MNQQEVTTSLGEPSGFDNEKDSEMRDSPESPYVAPDSPESPSYSPNASLFGDSASEDNSFSPYIAPSHSVVSSPKKDAKRDSVEMVRGFTPEVSFIGEVEAKGGKPAWPLFKTPRNASNPKRRRQESVKVPLRKHSPAGAGNYPLSVDRRRSQHGDSTQGRHYSTKIRPQNTEHRMKTKSR